MRQAGALLGILALFCSLASAQVPGRGWKQPDRVDTSPEEKIEPLAWNLQAAAHFARRAGFSASLAELEQLVEQGYAAALDQYLHFEAVDDSALEQLMAQKAYELAFYSPELDISFARPLEMNQLWLLRMIHSRRQLLEKMTFFWHDHFATSLESVPFVDCRRIDRNCPDGLPLMQIQNETLRAHALGNFKEMVEAVAQDPAMIVFLDSFSNVATSPNENFSRELLELFTMGEGNGYSERDIQEAARAFTGWSLSPLNYRYFYNQFAHDHRYPKEFLGEQIEWEVGRVPDLGRHDGQRVIDIIFQQPQVADFVASKLWEFFVYPSPDPETIEPLAAVFRDSGYEIQVLMRAIFEHPHFMSTRAYRAKVKSPVELAVGAFRELHINDPHNLPPIMFFFSLGQLLYLPPDVGGWTSDTGWINTGTILGRYNFFNFLVSNRAGLYDEVLEPVDDQIPVEQIIQENELLFGTHVVDYFLRALLQDDVSIDTRYTLEDYLNREDDGSLGQFDIQDPVAVDKKVRGLIYLISLLPVYQLN